MANPFQSKPRTSADAARLTVVVSGMRRGHSLNHRITWSTSYPPYRKWQEINNWSDTFANKLLTCGLEKGWAIICICEQSVYDHWVFTRRGEERWFLGLMGNYLWDTEKVVLGFLHRPSVVDVNLHKCFLVSVFCRKNVQSCRTSHD